MASTVTIIHNLTQASAPAPLVGDSLPISVSHTLGQVYNDKSIVVADNFTAVTLWQASGGLATFQFGVIVSNVDILVEMRNNLGTPEYILFPVKANVPFYISGTSRGGTTARIASTVNTTGLGLIDRIVAQRNVADDVGDASVSVTLFN